MNEMSPLERHLRTWVPRPPSARLKNRIFAPQPPRLRLAFSPPWMAPAFACALLVLVVSAQRNPVHAPGASANGGLFAMVLSNRSEAPYLAAGYDQGRDRAGIFQPAREHLHA